MNIKIVRYRKKLACTEQGRSETIDGQLYIEGMRICDCAENAKSAIKAGQYRVSIIKCHQHSRKMPVVLIHKDVAPNCAHCTELECVSNNTKMPVTCPMFKPGNGVYHREDGSIIVGKYLAPGCLTHPKNAFNRIYDRIRKSAERQKQQEQNEACFNSAETRPGVGDSQRDNEITLTIVENYPKPASNELTPYQMGEKVLAQMGGRHLSI